MANSISSSGGIDLSNQLAMDANSLTALKRTAKEDSPEAIKGVAKQFEAVFVNMMLKSMREATPQDGPFDSEQSKMFTSMLDQQLSQKLADKGIGLADMLVRQLSKSGGTAAEKAIKNGSTVQLKNNFNSLAMAKQIDAHDVAEGVEQISKSPQLKLLSSRNGRSHSSELSGEGSDQAKKENQEAKDKIKNVTFDQLNETNQTWIKEAADQLRQAITTIGASTNTPYSPPANTLSKEVIDGIAATVTNAFKNISSDFAAKMSAYAKNASLETGLPAHFMIGQAALETGWGKKQIIGMDGLASNNLFGIKANANWTGRVVSTVTSEYINGVKQQRIEKFRAYDSYADSFKDFANMIKNSPRYKNVMNNLHSATHYANAVQNAGYSTDPDYAIKLMSTIKKINP